MRFPIKVWHPAVYVCCCSLVHTWVLDEASCGPKDLSPNPTTTNGQVRTAITAAMTMAQQAFNELSGVNWANADANKRNVYGYIFKDPNVFLQVRGVFHFLLPPTIRQPALNVTVKASLIDSTTQLSMRKDRILLGFWKIQMK